MGTKTKELQDPHQEKNHNLKISNNSSNFTYFLPEPIKTTNYECGLVEIKLPSIEFKEKSIMKLLEIEFYNDQIGISVNVQDVLDEIDKCVKINDLKYINYKKKIESIIIKLDSKNYNLSLIGNDEYMHLLDAIELLLKILKEDKPETSSIMETVTNWELHKLFEENQSENSKLINIVKKWEDNVYEANQKKELKFISTEFLNTSDLIDGLTEFASKNHQLIEFEINSGQFVIKPNQKTSLKFKNFQNFAHDLIQVQKSSDDKQLVFKLINKREKHENKIKVFCDIICNKYEKNILKTIFLNGSTYFEFENPTYYPIQLSSINRIDIKILNTKLEPVVLNSTEPIEILINIKKK